MNDKKKLDILLDRWRDNMNWRLMRTVVDESPAQGTGMPRPESQGVPLKSAQEFL